MSRQDRIEALEAEVAHWKGHAEESGRGFSEVCKTAARLAARNSTLVMDVEALADEWERLASDPGWAQPYRTIWQACAGQARAAIAHPDNPDSAAGTSGEGVGR